MNPDVPRKLDPGSRHLPIQNQKELEYSDEEEKQGFIQRLRRILW